jgi:hypothetical protein
MKPGFTFFSESWRQNMPHHLTNLPSAKYSGTGNFNANRFWQPEDAKPLPPATQDVRALHFDEDGRKITTVETTNCETENRRYQQHPTHTTNTPLHE